MDLLDYYREETERMKKEGRSDEEIEALFDSMARVQAAVVMATI